MKLDLSTIFDGSDVYFQSNGEIDLSEEDNNIGDIKILSPILYDIEIYKLNSQDRELKLKINFTYKEACHRCLKETKVDIETEVSGKVLEKSEEEIDDDKMENYFFVENDILDLSELIRVQVNLAIPMKTLCDEDCKGICEHCGIDLNIKDCNCKENRIDPRLEVLKDLFPEE